MPSYNTLTKAQLVEMIAEIKSILEPSLDAANLAGKQYSPEIKSQMAFEIGHLSGSIKQALGLIR